MYRFLVVTSVMTVAVMVLVISLAYEPSTATCRIANENECSSLDPHLIRWVHENRAARALYEGRTAADPVTTRPGPGVAERWDVSPDGRTYTFHLRADARWSNGDAVTAEDFLWSWDRFHLIPKSAHRLCETLIGQEGLKQFYPGFKGALQLCILPGKLLDLQTKLGHNGFQVGHVLFQIRHLDT